MNLELLSFAFPGGVPQDADLIMDVRHLANPLYRSELSGLTGLDAAVRAYLCARPETGAVLGGLLADLRRLIAEPTCAPEKILVAIGCSGGRHRSVYVAEYLGDAIRRDGITVSVVHRDIAESQFVLTRRRGPRR